jgi:hypothetical protein
MIVQIDGENEMMIKVDPFYEYILKSLKKRYRKTSPGENQND